MRAGDGDAGLQGRKITPSGRKRGGNAQFDLDGLELGRRGSPMEKYLVVEHSWGAIFSSRCETTFLGGERSHGNIGKTVPSK